MTQTGEALAGAGDVAPAADPPTPTEAHDLLSDADLVPDRALTSQDLDAFGHTQIARQVAALVQRAGGRANVALFGPWGSGKSSMCSLIAEELPADVRLVRYDAWKFGGDSLRRNFISHAASELGLHEDDDDAYRQFHRGLYENRRTADLSVSELVASNRWKLFLAIVSGSLLFTLAGVLIYALVAWLAGAGAFGDQVARLLRGVGPWLWAFMVAVVGALKVLEGARVDVEQTAPSAEEQFTRTFSRLVQTVTTKRRPKYRQLVFFIDELDRCDRDDVVATLVALKTFLDEANCVFIVAADREVLEEALTELPQSTPIREHEPYYSSASEFLDKVFQFQISLPPLRGTKLTAYARDLVKDRGGLWGELQRAEPHGRALDRVMSALIPSHVRSPRRVKVLLNNFATTARIARGRGVEWPARAREIAKLTVLRTEFPALGRDLHLEPRLPSLLLDPPDNASERTRELLSRHRLPTPPATAAVEKSEEAGERVPEEGAGFEEPDRLLLPGGAPTLAGERARLAAQQREYLRRYLRRMQVAAVRDPGRDLLFLEPAGAAEGLTDAELGQAIEDLAADDPLAVALMIRGASQSDRLAAVTMLADQAEREIGDERANLITALSTVLADLGRAGADAAPHAVQAFRHFLLDEQLSQGQGLGAVWAGIHANDAELVDAGFEDDSLLAEAASLSTLWPLLDRLPPARQEQLSRALVRTLGSDDSPMLQAVSGLPAVTSARILEQASEELTELLGALAQADEQHAQEVVRELVEASDAVPDGIAKVARSLLWRAVSGSLRRQLYPAVRELAPTRLAAFGDPGGQTRHVLHALAVAPAADWILWAPLLVSDAPVPSIEKNADQLTGKAVAAIITAWPAATPVEQESAIPLIERIAATGWSITLPAEITAAGHLGQLLATGVWPSDANGLDAKVRGYAFLQSLQAADAVTADAAAATQDTDFSPVLPPHAGLDPGRFPAFLRIAPYVSEQLLARLVTAVAEAGLGDAALLLRLALARRAGQLGVQEPGVPTDDLVRAVANRSSEAVEAICGWLPLRPAAEDVARVLATGPADGPVLRQALHEWAADGGETERSRLWAGLSQVEGASGWRRVLLDSGVARDELLTDLVKAIRAASTAPRRSALVAVVLELAPFQPMQQRELAELALYLLKQETKGDFESAARLVPVLGSTHRKVMELRTAFSEGERSGKALSSGLRKPVEQAGLLPPVPKKPRGLRRLLG